MPLVKEYGKEARGLDNEKETVNGFHFGNSDIFARLGLGENWASRILNVCRYRPHLLLSAAARPAR